MDGFARTCHGPIYIDGGPLLLDAQVGASRSGLVLATTREALLLAWLAWLALLLASDVVDAVWEDDIMELCSTNPLEHAGGVGDRPNPLERRVCKKA